MPRVATNRWEQAPTVDSLHLFAIEHERAGRELRNRPAMSGKPIGDVELPRHLGQVFVYATTAKKTLSSVSLAPNADAARSPGAARSR